MKTADSAVYLFTQNYTQTAITCRDNKSLISIEMFYLAVYWWNNGSIVNYIIQRVSNELILYKVTCGGRAGAFPEWISAHCSRCVCVCVCVRVHCSRCVCALRPLLQVCVYLDGSNAENKIALLVILCIIMYVKKKIKTDIFFTKPITDYGKMLKNVGKISVNL